MYYRYIAFIIIISVTVYIGYMIRNYSIQRIKVLSAVIDMIEYIKNQISFYCTPTQKLFINYEAKLLESVGILEALKTGHFEKIYGNNIYFDKKVSSVLFSFFEKFGKTSADQQVSNCEYAIAELLKCLEIYKAEENQKYKAYSSLVVISGLMVIIFFL